MRDIPTSPRVIEIKRKRRNKKIFNFFIVFVIFILIFFILSFLSKNKKMLIDNIIVEGNHIIDRDEIKKEVYRNITGKYFYLFSKSNSLIYPQKKIYNSILLNFPRIESLSVSRTNLKTINISIKERVGTFLYCGKEIPINKEDIGENCYFVNNDGYIFDQAPYFSGDIYFKYYLDLDNGESPLKQQMLIEKDFHEIVRFIDDVKYLGLKPVYIYMDKDGTNYLYLAHNFNNTVPKIIFKNDADYDLIYENLYLAMKKKEFVDEINSKYNMLLYIDLRFKNKVLYKFST